MKQLKYGLIVLGALFVIVAAIEVICPNLNLKSSSLIALVSSGGCLIVIAIRLKG